MVCLYLLKNFFMDNGFDYFNWIEYCPELFADRENLTIKKPTRKARENIKKALVIFRSFGKIDVGQSMVMQNQIVLGVRGCRRHR